MANSMGNVKDEVADEIVDVLDACELHGRTISTVDDVVLDLEAHDKGRRTVTCEARYLKALFIKIVGA
jgi:tetratricopeptide repeat protein 30